MENTVPLKKSFRNELIERAWYMRRNNVNELKKEKDVVEKNDSLSVAYDKRLKVIIKNFENNINWMIDGLFIIGATFFTISILLSVMNMVTICVNPAVQNDPMFLWIPEFVLGSLAAATLLLCITKFEYPKYCFGCSILVLVVWLFCVFPFVISRATDFIFCVRKQLVLRLKYCLK